MTLTRRIAALLALALSDDDRAFLENVERLIRRQGEAAVHEDDAKRVEKIANAHRP